LPASSAHTCESNDLFHPRAQQVIEWIFANGGQLEAELDLETPVRAEVMQDSRNPNTGTWRYLFEGLGSSRLVAYGMLFCEHGDVVDSGS